MPHTVPDRRRFFGDLGSRAAALAVVPLPLSRALSLEIPPAALPDAPPARPDESYWALVRAQFPIRDGLIPLNAANLCPAPRSVIDAVQRAAADVDADVSFQNRAKYDELRDRAREGLARYLGASADEIAIVRNTTEGNNTIVGGLPLGRGDEVVVQAGAEAIVIFPISPTALNQVVKNACDKGVKVFAYDAEITEPCAYNISIDQEEAGRVTAEWLVKKLGEGAFENELLRRQLEKPGIHGVR